MLTALHRHPNYVSVEGQLGRFIEYTVFFTFPTRRKVAGPVGRQIRLLHWPTHEQLREAVEEAAASL